MSQSEAVRDYVYRNYIVPARAIKTASITIVAADVLRALGFDNEQMSLVCDALDAMKFQTDHGIRLVERNGPKHGATATFKFSV